MVCGMHRRMSNEKGFTLIEVIVSLVLIGILAAIAGMGLVQITQGYVFTKQNAETAQKAQIAMTRIVKELGAATAITTAGEILVTYTRPGAVGNIITFENTYITVKIGNGSSTRLIDNVTINPDNAPFLDYLDAAGDPLPVPVVVPANIRQIEITLTVTGANDHPSTFTNRVTTLGSY